MLISMSPHMKAQFSGLSGNLDQILIRLTSDWLDKFGLTLDLPAACRTTLEEKTLRVYSGATHLNLENIRFDISIIPQYTAESVVLDGIALLIVPTSSNFTAAAKESNVAKGSRSHSNLLGGDLHALSVALDTSKVTCWQFLS